MQLNCAACDFPLGFDMALYVLVAFVPLQASGFHISVEIAA